MRKLSSFVAALALVAAACGSDDAGDSTTPGAEPVAPETAPAEVVFDGQSSDGSSIVVASVTLPSAGFIAVHSNSDGGPGPVIGSSALLAAGTSTDVVVVLDTPLTDTGLVFPMAHIDIDGDGEYTFMPPDNAVDTPAGTADGGVAVVGGEVTIEG